MKLILLIQTLIILAGAYYIYTLSKPEVPKTSEELMIIEPSSTSTESVYEPVIETTATTTVTEDTSGANDAHMEWPTFEADLESR